MYFIRAKGSTDRRALHLCCAPLDFAGEVAGARNATNYREERGSATGCRRERQGDFICFQPLLPPVAKGCAAGGSLKDTTEEQGQVAEQKAPGMERPILPIHVLLGAIPVWHHPC